MKRNPKIKVLDKALAEKGWKVVLLFRLTPIPFSMACYAFGVTKVTLSDFLKGSLGIVAFTSLYCYTGVSLRTLHHTKLDDLDHPHTKNHAMYLVFLELLFAVLVFSYIGLKAKEALREFEEEERRKRKSSDPEDIQQ